MGKRHPKEMRSCKVCGKMFWEWHCKSKWICSTKCSGVATASRYASRRYRIRCQVCGNIFMVPECRSKSSKYCSSECKMTMQGEIARSTSECRAARRRGRGQHGGSVKSTTYLKIHGRHIHRVVMESILGRSLQPGEVVHHKDGNRHNNLPENLVLTVQSDHVRLHFTKNRKCTVFGCGRKHAAKGFCLNHWSKNRKATRAALQRIAAGELKA